MIPGFPPATPFSAGFSVTGSGAVSIGTTLTALPSNAVVSYVLQTTSTAGTTGSVGASLRAASRENGLQYAAVLPPGTAQAELALLRDGSLLVSETAPVPVGATTVDLLTLLDMDQPEEATLELSGDRFVLRLASPREVEGTFGTLLVDTIAVVIPGGTLPEDAIESAELVVTGQNVPAVDIFDFRLETSGTLPAYGGDVLAQAGGGQLVLSPLDANAGTPFWFSVATAPTNELRVFLSEAIPTDGETTSTNASLTLTTRGIVGGVERDLPALRHTFDGSMWTLTAVRDGQPLPLNRVEIWSGGVRVAEATGVSSVGMSSPPVVSWPTTIWFVDDDICYRNTWSSPALVWLNGQRYEATELRVQTDTYGQPVTALTGQQVEATALGALVFSGLETGTPTYLLDVPEAGPDGVTVRWGGIGGVLEQAPTVNGPWSMVPGSNAGEVTLAAEGAARFFRVRGM